MFMTQKKVMDRGHYKKEQDVKQMSKKKGSDEKRE
jgi:hypothetical protein